MICSRRPARLVVTDKETGQVSEYDLVKPEARIGRALALNDIILNQAQVSREHAILKREDDTYRLVDLGSSNGTKINGVRIDEKLLEDGDMFTIGRFLLRFRKQAPEVELRYKETDSSHTVVVRPSSTILPVKGRSETQSLSTGGITARLLEENLAELEKKAETLTVLYELNRTLASVFSPEDIFERVSETLFRLTPAERFVVLFGDEGHADALSPAFVRHRPGTPVFEGEISRTVVQRVLSERLSLLSFDALNDQRLSSADSILVQQIASIMCAPLIRRDSVLGVIYTDSRQKGQIFGEDDLDLFNALSAQASISCENASAHERLVREALARAAYARFMPRPVVEEILANPESLALGGSSRPIAVLFSDIRGFSTLTESLPPETVVRILNEYFSALTPIIFEHHGFLDKYMGDGLMALFGASADSEAAAQNAVSAAIAMQRQLDALRRDLRESGLPEISAGIGIGFGLGTVGYIGSRERMDYTAIGDVVNLAARLEKQAKPGQIIVSESTKLAIGESFDVEPFGVVSLKGRKEPARVYEVNWREIHTPA